MSTVKTRTKPHYYSVIYNLLVRDKVNTTTALLNKLLKLYAEKSSSINFVE